MSQLNIPMPVKPVMAVFSAFAERMIEAARVLETEIGLIDYISQEFSFDQTEYYRDEMGWPLVKRLLAVEKLMDPADLVALKIRTMEIEKNFYNTAEARTVNIDPGYISAERLVLATGKNYIHRIYLDRGVWADLTLIFEQGQFRPLPWTYPDYASLEAVSYTHLTLPTN